MEWLALGGQEKRNAKGKPVVCWQLALLTWPEWLSPAGTPRHLLCAGLCCRGPLPSVVLEGSAHTAQAECGTMWDSKRRGLPVQVQFGLEEGEKSHWKEVFLPPDSSPSSLSSPLKHGGVSKLLPSSWASASLWRLRLPSPGGYLSCPNQKLGFAHLLCPHPPSRNKTHLIRNYKVHIFLVYVPFLQPQQ